MGLSRRSAAPSSVRAAGDDVFDEAEHGHPSHVTEHLEADVDLDDDEIRERMSGNLCRCGAYVGILAAVREATGR